MKTRFDNKAVKAETADLQNLSIEMRTGSAAQVVATINSSLSAVGGTSETSTTLSTLDVLPTAVSNYGAMLDIADASAQALAAMKTGAVSKLDTQLAALYFAQSAEAKSMSAYIGSVMQNASSFSEDKKYVVIDTIAKNGDGAALLSQLEALGLKNGSSFGAVASGQIAVSQIPALAKLADLGTARESQIVANAGSADNQADHAQHSDAVRTSFGVDGSGVRIGILSDSFDKATTYDPNGNRDTMATDIASGDLPTDTRVLQDFSSSDATDEGRAMAQLAHDIAPGAAIDFATGQYGMANFANNILNLAAAGDRVIVDDLTYFGELYYQNGIIAQAVNQVAAEGVSYFSAAGNSGTAGYSAPFVSGGTQVIDGQSYNVMQFAPGQNYIEVQSGNVSLNWDTPGASAGGKGASNDLDLFVLDANNNVVAQSTSNNIGGDPVEFLGGFSQTDSDGNYIPLRLVVGVAAGSAAPGSIHLVNFGGYLQPLASNVNNDTIVGHAAAAGSMAVGAVDFSQTPAYGVDPVLAEYYTSAGHETRLFDDDGNRLSAPETGTVAFTAVDGGNTTFFGNDGDAFGDDDDPDDFGNFHGTSAAAPDAAATAALLLSIRPDLTPSDIRALLTDSAIDITAAEAQAVDFGKSDLAPGFDDRTGAGLIQADRAAAILSTGVIANDQATILSGTHLNDTINANNLSNTIDAAAGNDIVNALGGDDIVHGGGGDDVIYGNTGNDVIFGDAGNDTLSGGQGDDQISGGAGDDYIEGGLGNDTINGGTGSNVASYAHALSGVIVTLGQDAGDNIPGSATGGAGTDSLYNITGAVGSSFNDTINGNDRDNRLTGGGGADQLFGADGNDTLDGGTGGEGTYRVTEDRPDIVKSQDLDISSMDKALSIDTTATGNFDLTFNPEISNSLDIPHVSIDATTPDLLPADPGAGQMQQFEWYRFSVTSGTTGVFDIDHNLNPDGTPFDTMINLVDANGSILASNDDDNSDPGSEPGASLLKFTFTDAGTYYLNVGQYPNGDPTTASVQAGTQYQLNVSLSSAEPTYTGADAGRFDILDGGKGQDTASYGSATAGVTVDLSQQGAVQQTGGGGADYLSSIENLTGSDYADALTGDKGSNVLMGGAGTDTLAGLDGSDTLYGNVGDDTLFGGQGNDLLDGGQNNDILYGGDGDDTLLGGRGADTLIGGIGADTFRYRLVADSTSTAQDVIADFQTGVDKLDLSAIHTSSADTYTLTRQGGDTLVTVDIGGNGSTDMAILVKNANGFSPSDILWSKSDATPSAATMFHHVDVSGTGLVDIANRTEHMKGLQLM